MKKKQHLGFEMISQRMSNNNESEFKIPKNIEKEKLLKQMNELEK